MVMMLMMLMMTVEEVWAGRTGWGLVVSTTSLLSDFLDLRQYQAGLTLMPVGRGRPRNDGMRFDWWCNVQ